MGRLANFVSMHINTMPEYKGVLEFEYLGEAKNVPYSMDNLGGTPHIYIQDKRGHHYTFFYRKPTKTWELSGNYTLKWPQDFIDVLFACFDLARQKHGL